MRCFVPPYMVERMARCADPRLRELALADLARCAAVRAVRAFAGQLPTLLAPPAPTARRQRLVYDAGGRDELPGTLVRSEGEDAVADRAVNEAFDHSGATFDFWLEVFGRRSLDDAGMTLISSVHVGEPAGGDRYQPLDNAFWDGRQMAYGDGDGIVFRGFTQALDVVAHELAHGVQAFTSNLVYRGQSGALNEHFADVFGTLVRQWHRGEREAGAADWLVGREVLVPAGTRRAIRDMEQPGTAYRDDPILGSDPQPAHMDGLYRGPADAGGVHINSGIPNRAFVLAAKSLGGPAWGRAGRIWHDCMLQLSRTSTFADMARLTAQVAGDRFDEATKRAVRAAWRRVGL